MPLVKVLTHQFIRRCKINLGGGAKEEFLQSTFGDSCLKLMNKVW